MSFSPRTYYVSVHTRFNIDADLFLLARVAATTAPSVSDVVTTGVHVQCKAEKTCSGVVSGLQPLTSYDVYYWYRSEAGAQRVRTTDVVPFALSLEGVGAERDHVNVVVSMEERGGYVWCRVHEVDMVPTVEQFKLTTPLVLEDGAARGVKRVDDLRAGVYARIRPPAALHLDGDVKNAGQHRFQLSLYRRVRLRKALPAAVARPVIGQRQAVVSLSHSSISSSASLLVSAEQ